MYKAVKPRQRVVLAGFVRVGKDAMLFLISVLG